MTRILILLVAGSACALLPRSAVDAGCHAVQIQKQAVVAYAPSYPGYVYQVGQGLQLRAAIEVAKEELRAEMRAMQLSAAERREAPPSAEEPERLPITAEVDRWQLVKANCASCHSTNAEAMEAVDMTDLSALTCEQKLACIAAVLDGKMPKGKKLDPQSLGNLLGEFSGAETAHAP